MLDYCEAGLLEQILEQLVRSDHTVVVLVNVEPRVMYIFFDEDHSIFLVNQAVLSCFDKEFDKILICEVAEDPLNPDHIVAVLSKVEFLQAYLIEST